MTNSDTATAPLNVNDAAHQHPVLRSESTLSMSSDAADDAAVTIKVTNVPPAIANADDDDGLYKPNQEEPFVETASATVAASWIKSTSSVASSISDEVDSLDGDSVTTVKTSGVTTTNNKNKIIDSFEPKVVDWDKKSRFSDMIKSGLDCLGKPDSNKTVMLFQSPSCSDPTSRFYNGDAYQIHDYPPSCSVYRNVLGPCRYSSMNGSSLPSFLESGTPPTGLVEHWMSYIPGFERPDFVNVDLDNGQNRAYAYLPCENVSHHVNDPLVHYHLVGKDALHLMTDKTTKLLPSTEAKYRPCVVKTTHSMASKGIFVIENDQDETEFFEWLEESGNPPYIVTGKFCCREYVLVDRAERMVSFTSHRNETTDDKIQI